VPYSAKISERGRSRPGSSGVVEDVMLELLVAPARAAHTYRRSGSTTSKWLNTTSKGAA